MPENKENGALIPEEHVQNLHLPAENASKKSEVMTSQRVINSLERFVLDQRLDKSYKKMATDAISSSKRTLESLLARNGGHQNIISGESAVNNKNYTLDADGRVCLVRNSSRETSRHQELLFLQKDTHELRCLRDYLMLALESIMHTHREMMVNHVRTVKENPRRVSREDIDNALQTANTQMVSDFLQMALSVDESIAREEVKSENRRKLKKSIEMETFLMRMMLEMEDIREVDSKELVRLWRSHKRSTKCADVENAVSDSTN